MLHAICYLVYSLQSSITFPQHKIFMLFLYNCNYFCFWNIYTHIRKSKVHLKILFHMLWFLSKYYVFKIEREDGQNTFAKMNIWPASFHSAWETLYHMSRSHLEWIFILFGITTMRIIQSPIIWQNTSYLWVSFFFFLIFLPREHFDSASVRKTSLQFQSWAYPLNYEVTTLHMPY